MMRICMETIGADKGVFILIFYYFTPILMRTSNSVTVIIRNQKIEKEYIRSHNNSVSNLFVIVFLAYLFFTSLILFYSVPSIIRYLKYPFLIKLNATGIFLIAAAFCITNILLRRVLLQICKKGLNSPRDGSRYNLEMYYSTKNFLYHQICYFFYYAFLFTLCEKVSFFCLMSAMSICTLLMHLYLFTESSIKNALRYYLIGQMFKIYDRWRISSGVGKISVLSFLFGSTFLYCMMSVLFCSKSSFGPLIDTCTILYSIWSMCIFITANIYAGYLCGKYRSRTSPSEKGSVFLILYLIWNILIKIDRIVGVSIVYMRLSIYHMIKCICPSKKNDRSNQIDHIPVVRGRYDQIEMEVINYIEFRKYHTITRSDVNSLTTKYWIVTKSMFIGEQLSFLSSISLPIVTFVMIKILETTPIVIKQRKENGLSLFALLITFLLGFCPTDHETQTEHNNKDNRYDIYNRSILSIMVDGRITLSDSIPLIRYLVCTVNIFLLFFAVRSLEYISFRTLFLFKDAHISDSKRTANILFTSVINELHKTLMQPDQIITIEDTQLEAETYNTVFLSILSSI